MNEFYEQLNRERENNRWTEWENHRSEITKLVHLATSHLPHQTSAIILGAGNCDDLDLISLIENYDNVALADVDFSAMMDAVRPLEMGMRMKIDLISTDFTKLDEINFYRNLQDLLDKKASAEHIVEFLDYCITQLGEIQILTHYKGTFQVVISSAVYTQLFYMNALQIFAPYVERYKQKEITTIMNGLLELRNVVIQNYNDLLTDLASPHAVIVVWSDVLKVSPDKSFMETVNSFPTDSGKIQFIMNEVKRNGRMEGMFGLQDMQNRFASHGRNFHYWIWPYSSKNHCLTFGISGRIRSLE
ncbi:hypothetical protein [Paenibacillus alginolyticus]|uniref:Methyltransferase n=1 Tax=Paenibacillus alginolyticus TaxID=59839 RepID=A0ABT4GB87_9BACL|nr:hypothetical protein [Paenibacillus alginolyticus]MCY9693417.1 hypothetical protein [Paenibacillus alginolyticus]MEC0144677.1 hypothetical protein [Paenibacillus alginolyticus]